MQGIARKNVSQPVSLSASVFFVCFSFSLIPFSHTKTSIMYCSHTQTLASIISHSTINTLSLFHHKSFTFFHTIFFSHIIHLIAYKLSQIYIRFLSLYLSISLSLSLSLSLNTHTIFLLYKHNIIGQTLCTSACTSVGL